MDEAPLLRRFAHVTEKGMPMKALIPAAGLGTRFLPATKAQPKEMLLVVDRPAIQYVVEEALDPEEVDGAMQEVSDAHGGASVIAVMPVPDDQVSRFGVIAGAAVADDVWKIDALVEKPALEDAPSNLAVFGRYLLSARVMELLADVEPGVGGEIQLTDALDAVLREEEMYALIIDPADGFDTGTVESWLETNNVLFGRAAE